MMSARLLFSTLLITVIYSHLLTASAGIWYVDAGVTTSGDGTSWQTAFKKTQEGIEATSNGDTIIVARGTVRRERS